MKTKQRKHHLSFVDILIEVGADNAQKLMTKARIYNYLAKISESAKQTEIAYHWKNRCLRQLLEKCKKHTSAIYDDGSFGHNGLLLIHLDNNKYGLHTHSNWINLN